MYSLTSATIVAGAPRPTFRNPIAPGADPWVVRHGGWYYWCLSESDLGIAVYRSRTLTSLGEKHVVWRAPASGPYSGQIWAPELHHLDGRWFIYVAASDGRNERHRMIALASEGDDPTRPFRFKAEFYTGDDFTRRRQNRWAIDGTLLEQGGKRYFIWSGWADARDEQWLYIAPMATPWSLAGARVRLCANDDFVWERVGERRTGRGLNEAPQILQRDGRTFLVYSCSGSWEPTYKLGLLELAPGGDPLNPAHWSKHPEPVLTALHANACGPGHCSFTHSADGAEDWIVFHAKVSHRPGWDRTLHAQPFTFVEGRPYFGPVQAPGISHPLPAGDPALPPAVLQAQGWAEAVRVRDSASEAGEALAAG